MEKRQQQSMEQKAALLKNAETIDTLKLYPIEYHTNLLAAFSDVAVLYDGRQICRSVSFQVREGERIFIEGKNGSGKSSLLKLLSGHPIEHTGTLTIGSGLVISYVPQDTSHLMGTLAVFSEENGLDESLFKAVLRKMDFERVQFEKI